tara:strand:- start:1094 stop:1600 length:507 start_codon:yes stop_codon:yes gene_type:complete
MYKKGLRNIDTSKKVEYREWTNCKLINNDDPEICDSYCDTLSFPISKEKYNNIRNSYKEEFKWSEFGVNYNSSSEKATTFVTVFSETIFSYIQCKKKIVEFKGSLNIKFQFNDKSDFELLKKDALSKAEYVETLSYFSKFRFYDKISDRDIVILIHEEDDFGVIDIQL